MATSDDRPAVARVLAELEAGLADLVNALAHSDADALLEHESGPAALRLACESMASINYGMQDDAESRPVCLGAIGVTADILRRAKAVNETKLAFKALCAPLRRTRVRIPVKDQQSLTAHISALRVILRSIQRSDLNLLSAYRKIPLLEVAPSSITYTRAMTRAVRRQSVEEVYTLLSTKEGPLASADRARLETLSARETHLAYVKERYGNVRANVLLTRLDARGRGRLQLSAELPILYARGRHAPPAVTFAPERADEAPRRMRESNLKPERFLVTLPVFRYA